MKKQEGSSFIAPGVHTVAVKANDSLVPRLFVLFDQSICVIPCLLLRPPRKLGEPLINDQGAHVKSADVFEILEAFSTSVFHLEREEHQQVRLCLD